MVHLLKLGMPHQPITIKNQMHSFRLGRLGDTLMQIGERTVIPLTTCWTTISFLTSLVWLLEDQIRHGQQTPFGDNQNITEALHERIKLTFLKHEFLSDFGLFNNPKGTCNFTNVCTVSLVGWFAFLFSWLFFFLAVRFWSGDDASVTLPGVLSEHSGFLWRHKPGRILQETLNSLRQAHPRRKSLTRY